MKPLDHADGFATGFDQTGSAHLDGRVVHAQHHHDDGSVTVLDAALLFAGHYHQSGHDLIISRPFESVTIHDYFSSDVRPDLVAPDGSTLSSAVVLALTEGRPGVRYAGDEPPARPTAIGRVESASGSASVIRNGQTIALHAGDLVFKGDAVETGEQGSLAITFIDGTAFTLAESARMVLNDMVYQPGGTNNSSLLSLVQGSITFVAGEVAHTGEMKVDTPVATMGIRGTAVHVRIGAHNGPTRFSVMREPNGRVGSYILYDHKTGAALATVSEVANVIQLQLSNGQIVIDTIAKTPLDFQQEQDLTHQVFAAYSAGQQDSLLKALMQTQSQQGAHGSSGPPQTGPDGGQLSTTPPTQTPTPPPVTPPAPPTQTPPTQQNDSSTPPPTQTQQQTETPTPPTAPTETVIIAKNAAYDGALPIPSESIIGVEASNAKTATTVSSTGTTTVTGVYGDLTISADGTFHYVADHAQALYATQTGVDTFTYTVTNTSGLTATATLTFDVIGANSAPVIAAPSAQTMGVNHTVAITGVAISETGITDGETFIATLTDAHGNLTVSGSGGTVTGSGTTSLTITGTLAQVNAYLATLTDTDATTGSDTISLNVTDSYGNMATKQTIDITANGSPSIEAPTSQTIGVNQAAAISGVSVSESGNTDGETFTATLTDTNGNLSVTGSGGTVAGSGTTSLSVSGTFAQVNAYLATLTDTDATTGFDTISLNTSDGFGNNATQQTIAVTVNGVPVITAPSAVTTGVHQTATLSGISISETGNTAGEAVFTPPGGTTGETFTVTLHDSNGSLDLSSPEQTATIISDTTESTSSGGGKIFALADADLPERAEPSTLILGGTLDSINSALAQVTVYNNYPGTATITVDVSDSLGNNAVEQTITITINGTPLISIPSTQTVGVGQTKAILGVSLSESGNTLGTETFSATLTDTHGDLSVTGTGGTVSGSGTTSLTINGSLDQVNAYLATLTDTDATAGSDTITLNASDSLGNSATQQTIAITANGLPVITVPSAQTVGMGHAKAISGVSVSESGNISGEAFSATVTDTYGLLSVTAGEATVTGEGTKSLTISGSLDEVNAALATLTDTVPVAGQTQFHALFAVGGGTNGGSSSENDSILLNVTDSFGNSATQQSISVTANSAPSIAVPGAQTIGVNQATTISGISLSESGNTSGETFSVTVSDTHGNLSVTGSGGTVNGEGTASLIISGTLTQVNAYLATLTDTDASTGADTITLNASDGFGNSATQKSIAVTDNGAPSISVPGAQALTTGTASAISGISVAETGNTSGSETFSATLTDSYGLLSVTGSGGTVSGSGTTSLSISGVTLSQLNAYLGTLTDTDSTNGSDTITLNAADSFGNSAMSQTISVSASHAGWTGDTLGETYYFPTAQTVYQSQQNFTVPASGISGSDGDFSLAVGASTITASQFAFNGYWVSSSFNGFVVFDTNNDPQISGVTIDSSSNMAGLTASDISFTSNSVTVNWEGLNFTTSTFVQLDLTFDPPLNPSQVTLTQTLDGSAVPATNYGALTVADGTELALAGSVDNSGTINVNGASDATAIGVDGNVTLGGGGHITLSESNENYVFGTGTLTNIDNTIAGGGDIGNGTLIIHNAGLIEAQGSYALIVDTGANALVNTGTLEANGGTLIIDSPVTGAGHAIIAGGTLEFTGASDNAVTFATGSTGMLALDHSLAFTGSIDGFANQDEIDLGDIGFSAESSLSYMANGSGTGGTLSVSDGTHVASIALLGTYLATGFAMASDGHGGTIVTTDAVASGVSASAASAVANTFQASADSDGQGGENVTLADLASTGETGSIAWDQGSTPVAMNLANGLLSASQDLTSGNHIATLTFNNPAMNAQTQQTLDINIGGDDAPFMFAPTTGPAVLVGSASANVSQTITGSAYADTIVAGAGNDILTGGGGSDTFVFKTNMGNDQITDLHAANATGQTDVIDLSAFHFANYQAVLAATTTDSSGDAMIALGTHTLTLDHVAKADLQSTLFHL